MTPEEVELKVWEKYPKTADERRGCQTEIFFRNKMREEYRKKLKNENICQQENTDALRVQH